MGIARALAADPPLLLFDEPFAAVDPITRLELQRLFLELRRSVRKTALFVTHDIREAMMLASRIALLKDGALDVVAGPREFRAGETAEARAFLAGLERGDRMNGDLASEIFSLSLEHITMVAITIAIASAIALPAGVLLSRRPGARRWAVGFANIAQTIPSLALFGFLVPLPLIGGIGRRTAIVALCLYALLPILRNTLLGITGVDASVRESAVAMGMTPRQILWQVELPLAAPSIVAGLRLATVATIGTATIAAAIGGGGLGVFIFRGISMVDTPTVLAGAVPAAAMALAGGRGAGMDRTKNLACLTAACALALAGCAPKPAIVVGSKNFTEQVLLAEILAQHIERRLHIAVGRKFNLGGTLLAHTALMSGAIDLYPEYSGTALTAVLKLPPSKDPGAVMAQVRAAYRQRWGLEWLRPLGFNNTFAMMVRGDIARRTGIRTLSEAARAAGVETGGGLRIQAAPGRVGGAACHLRPAHRGRPGHDGPGTAVRGAEEPQGGHDRRQLDRRAGGGAGCRHAGGRPPLFPAVRMRGGGARGYAGAGAGAARGDRGTLGKVSRRGDAEAEFRRGWRAPAARAGGVAVSGIDSLNGYG